MQRCRVGGAEAEDAVVRRLALAYLVMSPLVFVQRGAALASCPRRAALNYSRATRRETVSGNLFFLGRTDRRVSVGLALSRNRKSFIEVAVADVAPFVIKIEGEGPVPEPSSRPALGKWKVTFLPPPTVASRIRPAAARL